MPMTAATVPMAMFLRDETRRLRDRGFDPEQALAVTATCRDEILAPLGAGTPTQIVSDDPEQSLE